MKTHNPSSFTDPDWDTFKKGVAAWQCKEVYKSIARSVLDKGHTNGVQLLCVGVAHTGWFWWKKVVGFRAVVADGGLWGHSGVQSSPLVAVEAAVINLYACP